VPVDGHRLTFGLPLPALVRVLANQLLLFGVHAEHRLPIGQERPSRGIDVTELGVAV
jgi:hypothetical protein